MKESLNKFLASNEGHGLLFLELPTGFGKTYNASDFIFDFLTGAAKNKPSRIFYLTPLRKNVDSVFNDILDKFKTAGKEDLFKSNALIIRANCEEVVNHILDSHPDDEFTRLETYRILRSKVDSYRSITNEDDIQSPSNGLAADLLESIRSDFEPAFRRDVERVIKRWDDCKTPAKRLAKIRREHKWLLDLYPAMLTSERKVILTTVDKFFHGNNPIIARPYRFYLNSITKGALVFLDESDAAKQSLLSAMIQNCTDYKLDLLRLVKTIHHSIVHDEINQDLFLQIESDDPNKTTKASFEKLKTVFEEAYQEHHLMYQFKLEDEVQERLFIFHDYTTATVIDGKDKNADGIFIKTNPAKGLNVLTTKEKDSNDNFAHFIADLYGVLKFFIQFCSIAAKNYLGYKTQGKLAGDEVMEIEDAITSVLNCFNLHDNDIRTLATIVLNDHKLPSVSTKKNPLPYDLYNQGFQYYSFENDPSHDFNTKIMMSFLNDTPEKFLLTLAGRASVVGLSATAKSETVTGNYNTSYLAESLGKSFFDITDDDVARIAAAYKERRPNQHKVLIHPCGIEDNEAPWAGIFENPGCIEYFSTKIIRPYMVDPNGNGEYFEVNRFCKMAKAIKHFIDNPMGKVLLVLTNRTLKQGSDRLFRRQNLDELIDLIKKEKDPGVPVHLIPMNSSDFEKQKEDYHQKAMQGGKVILVTSFPTAGTGQNLQYFLEEDGVKKEQDIDSIYVEDPTWLIQKVDGISEEKDLILFIYQVLALRASGEVSPKDASLAVRSAFLNFNKPASNTALFLNKTLYKARSINNHALIILKQAIGRINRTRTKRPIMSVYVSEDILQKRSFASEQGKLQTAEFAELINFAAKGDFHPETPNQDLCYLNMALEACRETGASIRKLMRLENGAWANTNMEAWGRIRDFGLRYPTASEDILSANPDMRPMYLHMSHDGPIDHYFYKPNSEDADSGIELISYYMNGEKGCTSLISSATIGLDDLMRCSYVRSFFQSKGYATSFRPAEYILIPNIMHDIYRGALGEAAGECLMLGKIHHEVLPITDPRAFEKFDFVLKEDPSIYIDFKYWGGSYAPTEKEQVSKIIEKLSVVHGRKAFVINIFIDSAGQPQWLADGKIYTVPSLLKRLPSGRLFTHDENCSMLKAAIEEAIHGN